MGCAFVVHPTNAADGAARRGGGRSCRGGRCRLIATSRLIRILGVGAIFVASCGGSDPIQSSDREPSGTTLALSEGDGINTEGEAVCAVLSVDVDLLIAAQSTPRPGLREIERGPTDARFLNVPQASGCLVGYAEPDQTRRTAIVEAYTWPTSVIDATQFADVFADRQPGRFRDEPHSVPGDIAFLIVVDSDGEPQSLFGIVAERGDRVVYVQSAGVGLDPSSLEQAAAAVLDGL